MLRLYKPREAPEDRTRIAAEVTWLRVLTQYVLRLIEISPVFYQYLSDGMAERFVNEEDQ